MNTRSAGLLLSIGVGLGLMAFRHREAPPDLSSPKATVNSFLSALKSQDTVVIQQCVKDSMEQDLLKTLFRKDAAPPHITVIRLIEEKDHDTAHVAVEFTMQDGSGQHKETSDAPMVDMFFLIKQGINWQIALDPLVASRSPDTLSESRPLSFVIALIGSAHTAKNIPDARKQARMSICLSNARQIALGMRMFIQDHHEITPPKSSSYGDLIFPYTKNRQVFTCPSDVDKSISYTYNTGIAGLPLKAFKAPANTVMIYEGRAGELNFRHDDHAAVGFVDGHCKMLSPEEADTLIWTVKVPKTGAKPGKRR